MEIYRSLSCTLYVEDAGSFVPFRRYKEASQVTLLPDRLLDMRPALGLDIDAAFAISCEKVEHMRVLDTMSQGVFFFSFGNCAQALMQLEFLTIGLAIYWGCKCRVKVFSLRTLRGTATPFLTHEHVFLTKNHLTCSICKAVEIAGYRPWEDVLVRHCCAVCWSSGSIAQLISDLCVRYSVLRISHP
jgi:hypothetical protein